MLKILLGLAVFLAASIFIARLVFPLPSIDGRNLSVALTRPSDNSLWQAVVPMLASHPGKTGIHPLIRGTDAFAARMLLIEQARVSVDAQYYIWHDDLTGSLLLSALRKAAERGVRVRLLVDDNGVSGLDDQLAALSRLPNMDVRLFNPFVLRQPKILNYLFDFFRLNHRMHNKSLTVDNIASVVGGRNIGDEYFDTGPNNIFLDIDVMAVGDVVSEVSSDFERYWSSQASFPIDRIVSSDRDGLRLLDERLETFSRTAQFQEYRSALAASDLVTGLLARTLALEWTSVQLVSDDPAKAQGKARRQDLMISRLVDLLGTPARNLDLIFAYFVPGKLGADQLIALEREGVQIRIMTNSFAANDVALVHSGYTKYRRDLLKAGVELLELKPGSAPHLGREELGLVGSSGSSLHAKTFSIDGNRVFVGSFNFDPRSALLNTEMGLMIESPSLAASIGRFFEEGLPPLCYRPVLSANDKMTWIEASAANPPETHVVEPGTSLLSRTLLAIVGRLPVEWML